MIEAGDGTFWMDVDGKQVLRFRYHEPPVPETYMKPTFEQVSSAGNILVRWSGTTKWNQTPPEDLRYRWRLNRGDWTETKETDVTFTSLAPGAYRFEVYTVAPTMRQDASPAIHTFVVETPWWGNPWVIGPMVLMFGLLVAQTVRVVQRDRRLREEAEEELQTAHDMQMGLMPAEAPEVEGVDIAGRCIPANHVGGDFFQYFEQDGKVALGVADVTGKAMEAAIPVVMFSGILRSQMELGDTLDTLFGRLNRTLYDALDSRTFVCFTMGELTPSSHTFRLSNAGCPYPYHFRAETGRVAELQVEAYPLGVRPVMDYPVIEIRLQPGDRVIFCSDGIVEAENPEGEQFGFEQTEETIRKACVDDLSPQATIDRILEVVNRFRGDAPQSDDMTCVVVKLEG